MAANTQPIYTKTPKNSFTSVTAADGASDGTDADVKLVYSADATNGGYIQRLVCTPRSTSGSTSTSAAVIRVYLNNGSTVGTASNNTLIAEIGVPIMTVNVTATTAVPTFDIPLNFQVQAGYAIYVGVTAVAANTAWQIMAVAGDY